MSKIARIAITIGDPAGIGAEITLKALSYFEDGNLRALPQDMKSQLAAAAREVDLERLPDISAAGRAARDHGIEL